MDHFTCKKNSPLIKQHVLYFLELIEETKEQRPKTKDHVEYFLNLMKDIEEKHNATKLYKIIFIYKTV